MQNHQLPSPVVGQDVNCEELRPFRKITMMLNQDVKATKLLLVEDYALIRAGMCALMESLPNVTVIAATKNAQEALTLLENEQPDIVMMDLELPQINGRDATMTIRKKFPNIQVIILSMYTDQQSVVDTLQAGASGYLPKSANHYELQQAIEAVMQGQTYLSPTVSHHLANYIRQENNPVDQSPLTPRQAEILTLISNGFATKEIAQQLNISIKTVETHRANIMERLAIYDVAGLVRYALKTGLIEA